jgi:ATP-binding cassette, subfamily B, bacterial PglK
LAGTLEMIGIGCIPIFVSLLVEPSRILGPIKYSLVRDWIRVVDQRSLILSSAGILAGLFLVKNLYLAGLVFCETQLTQSVMSSVSNRLFRAYLYSPYSFHLLRNPAELIRNLTTETSEVVEFLRGGLRLAREGLVLTVILTLLVLVDPIISVAVFSLLAFATSGFYFAVRRMMMRKAQLSQRHTMLQVQVINQSLGAIKEAKILGREPELIKAFRREVHGIEHNDIFFHVVSALPKLFLEVLAVAALLIVATGLLLLGQPVQIILPALALFGIAAVRLVPAATAINVALADIRYRGAAFNLVCAELELLETTQNKPNLAQVPVAKRLQAGIRLEHIHFCYPGTSAEALKGISLVIGAGEAVGFIGPSGSGKSTLIDILLGLLKPSSGHVYVDGADIADNMEVWQRQVGYIPQDIYLIDDSIRRNIAFGLSEAEIDNAALSRAITAAQLDLFVRSLPAGLETVIGNRGIRLSGGQRQRIGIARALYHDPCILVMDEATNALDEETEQEVIEAISQLRGRRTIITVAHRPTSITNCDRVYLMEDGQLIDFGSLSELRARHRHLEFRETPSERALPLV